VALFYRVQLSDNTQNGKKKKNKGKESKTKEQGKKTKPQKQGIKSQEDDETCKIKKGQEKKKIKTFSYRFHNPPDTLENNTFINLLKYH